MYIYILALKMASKWNRHCASCIGTISFPMTAGAYLDEGGCGDRAERVGDGDVIVT